MTVVVTTTSTTTALDIIKRAMRLLGVYAIGEAPSADESETGLSALNALMGSLSNTPMIHAKSLDTIALTASVATITVGPSGTTVTDRPIKVLDESYVTTGTTSYPLVVYTQQQYNDVRYKATTGIPRALYPLMQVPDVSLSIYPVPTSGYTLCLWSIKELQTFPALTTVVSLPPGYEDLLPLELAEAIGPEYERELAPSARVRLKRLRSNLAVTNLEVPMLKKNMSLTQGRYSILTDESY